MVNSARLRVLLVEDNPADARLIREMLMEAGNGNVDIIHVENLSKSLVYLGKDGVDVVLLDMSLPDSEWPHTLLKVLVCAPDIPVVVLSGLDDEERALKSVQKGAQDYLVKGRIDGVLMERTLRYAIERQRLRVLLKTTSKAVRESELRLRTIINKSPDGVVVINKKGLVRFVNPEAQKMFGEIEDGFPDIFGDFLLSPDRQKEIEIVREGAGNLTAEIRTVDTEWESEDVFIVTLRDITERKKAEAHIRLAAKVMESTLDGIFITDRDFHIHTVNSAFSDITEWGQDDLVGKNPMIMSAGDYDISVYEEMVRQLREIGLWEGEVWNRRHKSGEVYPAWLRVNSLKDERGDLTHYVGILTDITQRKLLEEHLKKMAHYDVLTGLPNRALFHDRLHQAVSEALRRQSRLAILFVDLDNFKPVNDTLGHDMGDLLLQQAAGRLRECVRESDTVARMGGDEFTIIIADVQESEDATIVAAKVLASLAAPFVLKDRECIIGASIGVAVYPDHGSDPEILIKHADAAMYIAKEQGRNRYHFYSGGPHEDCI